MSDRTISFAAHQQRAKEETGIVVRTIDAQADKYRGILPSDVDWEDFRNAFLIAVQRNPRLLEADRTSLFLELQRAAGDGLKPDGREGALVIFGDDSEDENGNPIASSAKGKKKVVWMPMVWGMTKLVRNTGNVCGIRVKLIYRGERVVVSDEDGRESYKHERVLEFGAQIDDAPANVIGGYAVVNYKDGTWEAEFMTRAQIDRVKAVSRAKKGPWAPWYDEMAKKTILRRLIKRLERSRELVRLDKTLEADTTLDAEDIPAIENAKTAHAQITQEFTAPQPDLSRRAESVVAPTPPPRQSAAPGGDDLRPTPLDSKAPERPETLVVPDFIDDDTPEDDTNPPVEIWPIDEMSGEVDQPEPLSTKKFAGWFVSRLSETTNPQALREHNADGIEECRVDPTSYQEIKAAIAMHARTEELLRQRASQAISLPVRKAIVALTPKGLHHDGNYRTAAKAEVSKLADEADIADWVKTNQPTYKNKAVEISIGNWLRDRRKELGIFTEDDVLQLKNAMLAQLRETKTQQEMSEWAQGPPKAIMRDWKVSYPALWREIVDAVGAKELELKGTPE